MIPSIFGKLSNLNKDHYLCTKYTIIVRKTEVELTDQYQGKCTVLINFNLELKGKYFFNDCNISKIKIGNSANKSPIVALIVNSESNHKATVINLGKEPIIVKNKAICMGNEAVLSHRDLIYIEGSVFYFFYSKEAKISNLKLRYRQIEKQAIKDKSSSGLIPAFALNANSQNSLGKKDELITDGFENKYLLGYNYSKIVISKKLLGNKRSNGLKNDLKIKGENKEIESLNNSLVISLNE